MEHKPKRIKPLLHLQNVIDFWDKQKLNNLTKKAINKFNKKLKDAKESRSAAKNRSSLLWSKFTGDFSGQQPNNILSVNKTTAPTIANQLPQLDSFVLQRPRRPSPLTSNPYKMSLAYITDQTDSGMDLDSRPNTSEEN